MHYRRQYFCAEGRWKCAEKMPRSVNAARRFKCDNQGSKKHVDVLVPIVGSFAHVVEALIAASFAAEK